MDRKLALLTGVGRKIGIAAAIASKLAADDWDLALTYWTRYDERMPWGVQLTDPFSIKEELEGAGCSVFMMECDLEQPESPRHLFESIAGQRGALTSALILCHCESVDSGILNTTVESFDRHFAVNARASWQLIKEFAGQIPREGGSIVALTSDHTVHNLPYGASKAALDRIVIAAARELADLAITANVVNPGPIDTGWMDEATRKRLIERQPSGRLGSPANTADLFIPTVSGGCLDKWPSYKIGWWILCLKTQSSPGNSDRLQGAAESALRTNRPSAWPAGLQEAFSSGAWYFRSHLPIGKPRQELTLDVALVSSDADGLQPEALFC